MEGFFTKHEFEKYSKKKVRNLPSCAQCGLYKTCITKKMKPYGKGRLGILIVAEAPGKMEDKIGRPLVGKTGMRLETAMDNNGINMSIDCIRTNALICRPPGNESPKKPQIAWCLPNLRKTIEEVKPKMMLLLGNSAVHAFTMLYGIENPDPYISIWNGFEIPFQKENCWVLPTFHPSFLMRNNNPVLDMFFDRVMKRVKHYAGRRPWRKIPDYEKHVEIVYDPDRVCKMLRWMMNRGGTIAFDYECTCLKPEYKGAEIVSASVCWEGKKTIAFPFTEDVKGTFYQLVRSPLKKIASNAKFEERWTWHFLNTRVRNWDWDTMLGAHVLNNSPGLTSVKTQMFIRQGLLPYDKSVKPFLESYKGHINRIKELPWKELLLYNGLDSYFEYHVAKSQKKEMEALDARCPNYN